MDCAVEFRPEEALLLACARCAGEVPGGIVRSPAGERLRTLLCRKVDEAALFLGALRHGLLPLLDRCLAEVGPGSLAPEMVEDLRFHAEAATVRSRVLTDALLRLFDLLEARGIVAVPHKGPAVGALVYGDPTLRPFGDLDLIVRPGEALRARELLLEAGYRDSLSPKQAAALLRSPLAYNFKLLRPEGKVLVELHWAVTSRDNAFAPDPEALWERLEPIEVAGRRLLHFAPEDLLLLLCQHGAKHRWKRLIWLADVAGLLEARPDLDWDAVEERARRLGAVRMLRLGLLLAEGLLGAALPPEVARRARGDRAAVALSGQVRKRLFCSEEEAPLTLERRLFRHRLRERWRDRLPFFHFRLALLLRRLAARAGRLLGSAPVEKEPAV